MFETNKDFDLSPAHGSRDGLPSGILIEDRCIWTCLLSKAHSVFPP